MLLGLVAKFMRDLKWHVGSFLIKTFFFFCDFAEMKRVKHRTENKGGKGAHHSGTKKKEKPPPSQVEKKTKNKKQSVSTTIQSVSVQFVIFGL